MRKLFEDFIDDIESKDLEMQSDELGEMRPEAGDDNLPRRR